MATFQCRIVSPEQELYSGEVRMLVATGSEGELGILPNHTPLITLLKPGAMQVTAADGTEEFIYVSGGVLEVQPKVVIVLADTAVRASSIDEAQVAEARKKAEQLLVNQKGSVDTGAALNALAESVAQIQTIQKFKNRA